MMDLLVIWQGFSFPAKNGMWQFALKVCCNLVQILNVISIAPDFCPVNCKLKGSKIGICNERIDILSVSIFASIFYFFNGMFERILKLHFTSDFSPKLLKIGEPKST